jgi:uncharacterized protein (TIGR02300 family)
VAKPEWGTKRACQACGAKFYDLGRSPIVCPKCGAEFDPESLLKSRRGRAALAPDKPGAAEARKPSAAQAKSEDEAELDEELETIEDDEEDEDMIEDASELDEDDDMTEVQGLDDDEET